MHGQEAFGYTSNMPSWKSAKSKKQIARNTKLGLIILAFCLGLLIFGRGVKFTRELFTPWQQSQTHRNYIWNNDFNLNILIKAKNISLLSYNPQDQKIIIIDVPGKTYLEVAHGFGKWQLGSVFDLGGVSLLKDTLTDFFGLPIDGFLDFSGKFTQSQAIDIVSEIRKNPFSGVNLLSYLKTDLTPLELIRLKMGLSKVRFDKIKQTNLESLGALGQERLADGTDILTADTVKLDFALSEVADPLVRFEHKTIAIFNSTDHPGLAQKAARLISNIGGDVIITSNGQNKFKTSRIFGEKSKTLNHLKQIFNVRDTIDSKDGDLVSSRAQINLFVGEDYIDR